VPENKWNLRYWVYWVYWVCWVCFHKTDKLCSC
jgi:hypothetical protein